MKILFATNHAYLPQNTGGMERNTHQLILALRRRGIEAGVLAAIEPTGALGLINRLRRRLRPAVNFPVDHGLGYPVYRGWDPESAAEEIMSTFRPDAVVVQAYLPFGLAMSFRSRVPTAVYYHGALRGDDPVPDGDENVLYLANSAFTRADVRRVIGRHALVIPPIVHPEDYRVESSGEAVLFVNPIPHKGVEIAFALAERCPEIPFIFVESWLQEKDERKGYRERVRRLTNVTWHRAIGDMRALYRRARLVLMPSIVREGWGRVVTEAQVSGIPVLASNRGALPETVGPGGIVLDPEADIAEWCRCLSLMWHDRDIHAALSAAALAHAGRPEIKPERVVDDLIEALVTLERRGGQREASGQNGLAPAV